MGTDVAVQRNPQMPVVEGLTKNVSSKTRELAAPRVSEGGPIDQGLLTDYVRILSSPQQPGNCFFPTFPPLQQRIREEDPSLGKLTGPRLRLTDIDI